MSTWPYRPSNPYWRNYGDPEQSILRTLGWDMARALQDEMFGQRRTVTADGHHYIGGNWCIDEIVRYNYPMNYKGQALDTLLQDYGGTEVSAMDVYGNIFELGDGAIQCSNEFHTLKANPIILGSWNGHIKREILFEDTFEQQLHKFQQADWAITNGVTYWGKRNLGNAQVELRAFIIDLDGITPKLFNNFLNAVHSDCLDGHGLFPIPNYIIMSGTNVHLYYLLDASIGLDYDTKYKLKNLKYGLIKRIWNPNTSELEKPQYQGLNQGFRLIGGKTKNGGVTRAFEFYRHPYSIMELNEYVDKEYEAYDIFEDVEINKEPTLKPHLTLEEAAKKYPSWYQRVVVDGGDPKPKKWVVKKDLYDWWLRKLWTTGVVSYGHRYFCIMALAIFAAKCGLLERKKVKEDAMALKDTFNSIKPDEPFTEHDIDSALECLDLRYCTFPRKDLERLTAVAMPANKRNGRSQADHLQMIRGFKEVKTKLGEDVKGGRPKGSGTKQQLILDYAKKHPNESQRQVSKALGISLPTVNKWLKTANC